MKALLKTLKKPPLLPAEYVVFSFSSFSFISSLCFSSSSLHFCLAPFFFPHSFHSFLFLPPSFISFSASSSLLYFILAPFFLIHSSRFLFLPPSFISFILLPLSLFHFRNHIFALSLRLFFKRERDGY